MSVRAAGPSREWLGDPFGEHSARTHHASFQLLGGPIRFDSNSARLLQLVREAFGNLPPQRLRGVANLRVQLDLVPRAAPNRAARARGTQPPALQMFGGPGFVGAALDGANMAIVDPSRRVAAIRVSPDMLRFAYNVRYELIEFAVYVLAARVRGLVPLHAAVVGAGGRGLLLMGDSGAGKSTLALHCMLHGMQLLSEDCVFVAPSDLRATGAANFLHMHPTGVRLLQPGERTRWIRHARVIRRRSGARKLEIDPRRSGGSLASSPLKIAAVVLLSAARRGALLGPVPPRQLQVRLEALQPYAARQPGWLQFSRNVSQLKVFELRRRSHPLEAGRALRALLDR
ncbi:MAG TPA: hypothetical protein VN660_03155 [Steroidobacteraceae bacterium]|nr:hypothetical protein [Steroidobacteraceae bacterium]